MRGSTIALLAGIALVLGACTTDDGTVAQDGTATVSLAEMNDSGITGTATLTDADGMTAVVVTLQNAGSGPQPIHIHPGTCADLDPAPQYPLTSVEGGASETTVEASLSSLQDGTFAINVHKSVEEAEIYVACGDIT